MKLKNLFATTWTGPNHENNRFFLIPGSNSICKAISHYCSRGSPAHHIISTRPADGEGMGKRKKAFHRLSIKMHLFLQSDAWVQGGWGLSLCIYFTYVCGFFMIEGHIVFPELSRISPPFWFKNTAFQDSQIRSLNDQVNDLSARLDAAEVCLARLGFAFGFKLELDLGFMFGLTFGLR